MTKRTVWLIALGVMALLAFALVTLPAGVAAGPLRKVGVEAASFGGSVWSGRANGLAWRGAPVGDVQWTLRPLALLSGRAAGQAQLARADGSVAAQFDASLNGKDVRLRDVNFALPLAALDSVPLGGPKGWRSASRGHRDRRCARGQ